MFCAQMLRDETTRRWLEEWQGHSGLYDLHHCDALRVRSADYLAGLLRAPVETLQIKKPIPGRTTRKNPYLKRRYFTYSVDIVPRKLALRVLVRHSATLAAQPRNTNPRTKNRKRGSRLPAS